MKASRLVLFASMGASLAVLGGCAVTPTGPSVMALPGTGKTFDQFQADDGFCRQYAFNQVGGVTANQAATTSALGSAAVGTALGAAAGAAFNGGTGAAGGRGRRPAGRQRFRRKCLSRVGLRGAERRYDYAYLQCMYAHGDRVPMRGRMMRRAAGARGLLHRAAPAAGHAATPARHAPAAGRHAAPAAAWVLMDVGTAAQVGGHLLCPVVLLLKVTTFFRSGSHGGPAAYDAAPRAFVVSSAVLTRIGGLRVLGLYQGYLSTDLVPHAVKLAL